MNTPWIIATVAAILVFAVLEGYAFKHPDREHTLSRFIADIGAQWPLSIGICGAFGGGLMVHFFWHYCPAGSISMGMLLTPFNFN